MRRRRDGDVQAYSLPLNLFLLSLHLSVLIGAERVTPPVPLLDLLDFLFAEPEVVADFVNEGLADGSANLVLGFVVCFDGTLEQRDAIGERIAVLPGDVPAAEFPGTEP